MLFSPFLRAALSRGLWVSGAGVTSGIWLPVSQAAELSDPLPLSSLPFAPALASDAAPIIVPTPDLTPTLRASPPNFAFRTLPKAVFSAAIAPPPDTFGQTPAELQPWLLSLSKWRPKQVMTRVLGRTAGGRPLIALEITPPNVAPHRLKRLVVLCRQHGNEPEATASGARFIREFLSSKDPKKQRLARQTALLIVPLANPDGAAVYRRRTDAKTDMNRDWGRQKSPEVQLLSRWIAASKPHLVVDVHQWLPAAHQHQPMAEASGGLIARQTAQRMAQNNARRGYLLSARSKWGLDTLCHRYFGQRFGIPAILLETRHRPGVPGARELAIQTSLTALWSAAETLAK